MAFNLTYNTKSSVFDELGNPKHTHTTTPTTAVTDRDFNKNVKKENTKHIPICRTKVDRQNERLASEHNGAFISYTSVFPSVGKLFTNT